MKWILYGASLAATIPSGTPQVLHVPAELGGLQESSAWCTFHPIMIHLTFISGCQVLSSNFREGRLLREERSVIARQSQKNLQEPCSSELTSVPECLSLGMG